MSDTEDQAHSPPVSILIASYNQRSFIAEALESAIAQDYPALEIIVADDASTDGTQEIVADYAARYPQLIKPIFNPENLGVTRNCNVALKHCTGKYIAFLGGDDLFLPGKIPRQVAWFEKDPNRLLCGHRVHVFYDDASRPPKRFRWRLRRGKGAGPVIRRGTFASCSIMVRADKIPPHGFEETLPLVSDYMMWVEVLARGGEFGFVRGTYAKYRRHPGNISRNVPRLVEDAVRALRLIEKRYPQYARDCRRAHGRFRDYQMGTHFLAQGQRAEGRKAFLSAIALEPNMPRAWLGLIRSMLPLHRKTGSE